MATDFDGDGVGTEVTEAAPFSYSQMNSLGSIPLLSELLHQHGKAWTWEHKSRC